MYKIGFIGAGNMGGALLSAACKKFNKENILVSDHQKEKADLKAKENGCISSDNTHIAKDAKFIFLGVKPQVMKDMLESIKSVLSQRADRFILVSMAAGLKCQDICEFLGFNAPVIRIMPNTPVAVSSGMTLYCTNQLVEDCELNEFLDFMKSAGQFTALSEELIDAGCAVSGCGPAFVYMFINALINGGVNCGLSQNDAKVLACNTVIGAAKMVLESNKSPDVLKTEVCSPGGCTIEGVYKLEDGNLENTVINAVNAAYEKSKILGK